MTAYNFLFRTVSRESTSAPSLLVTMPTSRSTGRHRKQYYPEERCIDSPENCADSAEPDQISSSVPRNVGRGRCPFGSVVLGWGRSRVIEEATDIRTRWKPVSYRKRLFRNFSPFPGRMTSHLNNGSKLNFLVILWKENLREERNRIGEPQLPRLAQRGTKFGQFLRLPDGEGTGAAKRGTEIDSGFRSFSVAGHVKAERSNAIKIIIPESN